MRSMSAQRRRLQQERRQVAHVLLAERGPSCELRTPVCRGRAEAPHELVGRAQGGSIIDRRNLKLACNPCNSHVEDDPATARARGWKCPRWLAQPGKGGLVPLPDWRAQYATDTEGEALPATQRQGELR